MRGGKAKAAASTRADSKLSVRKGSQKTTRRAKGEKDPNKPKRPPSAFFVFMEGFRKDFKQKHPNNKSVSVVGKAGGDKWKSMTEAEKAPYVAKAAKLKTEYQKNMTAYNKRQADGGNNEEEESEKSKSEVNDEEEEGSEEEEEEDE